MLLNWCFLLTILNVVVHTARGQGWQIDDEGCITPDRQVGDCVPIKMCKPMVDLLESLSRPVPPGTKMKINAYTCSYAGDTINVCCPNGPIRIGVGATTDRPTLSLEVRNHKYFAVLPKNCGYLKDIDDKIKNGQAALLNEFPWMALLNYKSRNNTPSFRCGATIVNDRWILTAAHCIRGLRDPVIGVRVGEHDISKDTDCEELDDGTTKCAPPVQNLQIEKIIPHPDYDRDIIDNDIGLIKVSKMNLLVENVRPVCLPTESNLKPESFNDSVVTGWGVTEKGRSSNILQKVSLDLVPLRKCQETYKSQPNAKVTVKQMCAGGKDDKDSCPGDSGGPLQVATFLNDEIRYVQLGVVSFGPKFCGLAGYPGVYSNVPYYMDWILTTIGEN